MSNLEHNLLAASAEVDAMTACPVEERKRIRDILHAFRGYLSEEGTTTEQDRLLRDIGVQPPR